MTWSHEDTQGILTICYILILYSIRKIPPFDIIWEILKITLIIILVICSAGLILRWIKNLL
jgi:hypothetical protein